MFPFIPIHHVIIDSLHLFLRISDVLINLLIWDLRMLDGHNRNNMYTMQYQQFLNSQCKVNFKFQQDKQTEVLKWRDLTGPEKEIIWTHRHTSIISIPWKYPEDTEIVEWIYNFR